MLLVEHICFSRKKIVRCSLALSERAIVIALTVVAAAVVYREMSDSSNTETVPDTGLMSTEDQ